MIKKFFKLTCFLKLNFWHPVKKYFKEYSFRYKKKILYQIIKAFPIYIYLKYPTELFKYFNLKNTLLNNVELLRSLLSEILLLLLTKIEVICGVGVSKLFN